MKFMCNTKPLVDSVSAGVINQNVSNFYKKSCILQLTAESERLVVNIESQNIYTEIIIPGNGTSEDGGHGIVFVDALKFKNLLNTIDSNTITLEFESWGLSIRAGKSKFTLPKIVESDGFSLTPPKSIGVDATDVEFSLEDWKYVQNKQLYALATTFINPVYTNVWVGEDGDCLTGDMDSGLFTHTSINGLGETCLFPSTIIRLFTSLPNNSKFFNIGDGSYLIEAKNDSYIYRTEFRPLYESDESVGDYNSNIFLQMMEHPEYNSNVNSSYINKVLSQATLLSSSPTDSITFKVDGNNAAFIDSNIQSMFECKSEGDVKYEIEFRLPILKKVFSTYDEDVYIAPLYQEEDAVGILIWDDTVTTIVSGIE